MITLLDTPNPVPINITPQAIYNIDKASKLAMVLQGIKPNLLKVTKYLIPFDANSSSS